MEDIFNFSREGIRHAKGLGAPGLSRDGFDPSIDQKPPEFAFLSQPATPLATLGLF